jgi:uncharacterized membrane protein
MTRAQKLHGARLLAGIFSALFGIAGFVFESRNLFGVALLFSLAWLVLCIASANVWIEDEAERIAPRHRKEDK